MTVAITVSEEDTWPVRTSVAVSGLTVGDVVTVYRVQGATRTALRGANGVTVSDTSLVLRDDEIPFGVPISYEVWVTGAFSVASSPATYSLDGGLVAVTDPIAGLASEVIIASWPSRKFTRSATVHRAGGRVVVVSAPATPDVVDVEFRVNTVTAENALLAVLENCTSGVVLIRQGGDYPDYDGYYAVTGWSVNRVVQDGRVQKRNVTAQVIQVSSWSDLFTAVGFTYQDVIDFYDGLTYTDTASDFASYFDAMRHDWS